MGIFLTTGEKEEIFKKGGKSVESDFRNGQPGLKKEERGLTKDVKVGPNGYSYPLTLSTIKYFKIIS